MQSKTLVRRKVNLVPVNYWIWISVEGKDQLCTPRKSI